jgi:hypothetical protein
MSDLLNRLINRAAGTTQRVQPVLASRYEARAFVEAQRATEANPEPAGVSHPKPDPQVERAHQQQTDGESISPRPSARERDLREAPPVLTHPLQVAPLTAHHEFVLPPLEIPAPQANEPSHLTAPAAVLATNRSNEPPPAQPMRVESKVAVVTSREVRQRTASTHPAAAVSQPVQAPVEVQVTIGHIEVRAAAPVPVPPRRVPRAGVSLDDYLRRRNGGAR